MYIDTWRDLCRCLQDAPQDGAASGGILTELPPMCKSLMGMSTYVPSYVKNQICTLLIKATSQIHNIYLYCECIALFISII